MSLIAIVFWCKNTFCCLALKRPGGRRFTPQCKIYVTEVYRTFCFYQEHIRTGFEFYPARGLLLAESAPTVGRGKTFWAVNWIFLRKQLQPRNWKSKNRSQGRKWTITPRAINGSLTKIGVVWQNSDFLAQNQILGQKKTIHFCTLTMFWPRLGKYVLRKKLPLPK